MTPKAFSYIRFSRLSQGQGDSLRRQSALAEEWCRANGATLIEDYRDLGVSAFRRRNETDGALAAFLAGVEDGRIPAGSYLLVESLDRVSRAEVERAMALFLQIINAGIIIVTLGDGHVYRSGLDGMMIDLMYSLLIMSRAHEESMTKSKRLSAAWRKKREDLAANGKPLTSKGPSWLKLVDGKWVKIPEKVAIVKQVFHLSASGMSAGAITRDLNARGVPTVSGIGEHWHTSGVVNILESRAVLGEFAPKVRDGSVSQRVRTTVRKDYFPAIISLDLFSRARRHKVSEVSMRGRKSPNVFRGILFDEGGVPYHYHSAKLRNGERRGYLRTYDAERGVGGWRSWPYQSFLAEFLTALEERIDAPMDAPVRAAKLETAQAALAAKEAEIANLLTALSGGYSKALEGALRAAESAQERLEGEVASLASSPAKSVSLSDLVGVEEIGARIRLSVTRITMDCGARTWSAEMVGGGRISRPPQCHG
jgi:DNA invertase Pin-like site-specific DNA recombinase